MGRVVAVFGCAVWRGLGWAVVNHPLQLQSDIGGQQTTDSAGG